MTLIRGGDRTLIMGKNRTLIMGENRTLIRAEIGHYLGPPCTLGYARVRGLGAWREVR